MLTLRNSLIVFVIFALLARWYYVCEIKNLCPRTSTPPIQDAPNTGTTVPSSSRNPLRLVEDGRDVVTGFEQITFATGSAELTATARDAEFLTQVAAYLQSHPDRTLLLTGYYLSSEVGKDTGGFADIGIARAVALRSKLASLGVAETRVEVASALLDDVMLSKTADFTLRVPKANVPQTFMIQK